MTSTPEGDRFAERKGVGDPEPPARDVLPAPERPLPARSDRAGELGTRLGAGALVGALAGVVGAVVSWLLGSTSGLILAALILTGSIAVGLVGYRRYRRARPHA